MSITNMISSIVKEISRRKLFTYASSGCYYLFMSLAPIAMLLCCILQFTPITETMVLSYVNQYFEASLAEIIERVIIPVYNSGSGILTVSILLTLYSASGAIKAIMYGMDAAYDFKRKSNYITTTLEAIVYMVLLLLAVVLTLSILVYGGNILLLIQKYLPQLTIFNTLLSKARFLFGVVLLAFFFTVLFTIMPAEKVRMKDQIPGAVFTAVIWVLFSSLFSFYVSVSNKYGAYGIIGTVMVAMMWIYYCLLFMMVGGLINSLNTPGKKEWVLGMPRDLFKPER